MQTEVAKSARHWALSPRYNRQRSCCYLSAHTFRQADGAWHCTSGQGKRATIPGLNWGRQDRCRTRAQRRDSILYALYPSERNDPGKDGWQLEASLQLLPEIFPELDPDVPKLFVHAEDIKKWRRSFTTSTRSSRKGRSSSSAMLRTLYDARPE
jgi:hypothetical protein